MKVLKTYTDQDGVKITVYAPASPRPTERTWSPFAKYSIASIGAKAMSTGRRGVVGTVG